MDSRIAVWGRKYIRAIIKPQAIDWINSHRDVLLRESRSYWFTDEGGDEIYLDVYNDYRGTTSDMVVRYGTQRICVFQIKKISNNQINKKNEH